MTHEKLPYKPSNRKVNGWTNYETWACGLWMDNDVAQYRKMTEAAQVDLRFFDGDKEAAALSFANWLQKEIEDKAPQHLKGLYQDLLNGAIGAINWYELAFNWMQDIELAEEPEQPQPDEPQATKGQQPTKVKFGSILTATPEILDVIARSEITEDGLTLTGELDRKQYEDVNRFLATAGAKWNKSKKRHVFQTQASREKLLELLETGKLLDEKTHFQAFYTPSDIAQELVDLAGIESGMSCLEPSAGAGAIALAAKEAGAAVECVEMNAEAITSLASLGFAPVAADFLTLDPTPAYDRVLMNPPFSKDQDIAHVRHAFEFLKPAGKLYAIMSPGFTNGSSTARVAFKSFVEQHGRIIKEMDAGAFKESGTMVRTIIVELEKSAS